MQLEVDLKLYTQLSGTGDRGLTFSINHRIFYVWRAKNRAGEWITPWRWGILRKP